MSRLTSACSVWKMEMGVSGHCVHLIWYELSQSVDWTTSDHQRPINRPGVREHVIKSTCDENFNQLTLGVCCPETLPWHKINLRINLRFLPSFSICRDWISILHIPAMCIETIDQETPQNHINGVPTQKVSPSLRDIYMLNDKIHRKKVSSENVSPLIKGSLEERGFCI